MYSKSNEWGLYLFNLFTNMVKEYNNHNNNNNNNNSIESKIMNYDY